MNGIIAAVPTPINTLAEPLRDLFVEHCKRALDKGCHGPNVLGQTGVWITRWKLESDDRLPAQAGRVTGNVPMAGAHDHVPFGRRKHWSSGSREQSSFDAKSDMTAKTSCILARERHG